MGKVLEALYQIFLKVFADRIANDLVPKIAGMFDDEKWMKRNGELLKKVKEGNANDDQRKKLAKEITAHINSISA